MMETQQQDERIAHAAALHAAFAAAAESPVSSDEKPADNGKGQAKSPAVSPLNGAPVPAGRPKGVRNKLTNLREAVLEAFDTVGGPEYLVRLANGTQSDRSAFVGLVSRVLPTQINANVEGGIQVQLSWLGQRSIGTTTAQAAEQITQVVDLERDSSGKYRIKDQDTQPEGATPPAAGSKGQEGAADA